MLDIKSVTLVLFFPIKKKLGGRAMREQSSIHNVLEDIEKRFPSKIDKRKNGEAFEKLIKKFLEKTEHFQFKNVWLFNDWPSREKQSGTKIDLGVDIVAEDYCGNITAIQCKNHYHSKLSKDDVNSFFTELGKKCYHKGILVSTSNSKDISENIDKTLKQRSKDCIHITLDMLDKDYNVDWWSLYKEKPHSVKIKNKLEAHQKKAVKDVINGLSSADRGKLIMPCGTGKTFTALKIAEEMCEKNGSVLFLCPSLSLVSQTHREFMNHSEKEINSFIVCSDKSIKIKENETQTHLHEMPIIPTTNYKELFKYITNAPKGESRINVIFSTYHSIDVLSQAQKKKSLKPFDLIICDEAHRTTGIAKKDKDDASYWTRVHNDKYIKAKKRLYMTATPKIYSQRTKVKGEQNGYDIFSMDERDEKGVLQYGKELHRLSFSEAISQKLLSDYKVVILTIDENQVSTAMQSVFAKDSEVNTDDAVKIVGCYNALSKKFLNQKEWDLSGEGYKDITDQKPMKRAVAFSNKIKESENLKTIFNKVISEVFKGKGFNCEAKHVDGKMSSLNRDEKLKWLKGDDIGENECRILSNARCLSEGVDVPTLDAVMFLQSRKSEIDIVQSVGRVMRKPRDGSQKEFGYIILPIVIKSDADVNKALDDNKKYDVIWKTIQAIRSHDDRLQVEIDKLPYSQKMPSNMVVSHNIGKEESVRHIKRDDLDDKISLSFIKKLDQAIVGKLVLKCGDREYLFKLSKDIGDQFNTIKKRITDSFNGIGDVSCTKTLEKFLRDLKKTLNDSVTKERAAEMLAMHSVTKPIFSSLFESDDTFTKHNPVSRSMDKALKTFSSQIEAETRDLQGSYESIRKAVSKISDLKGRQNLIKEIYEKVFERAMPKLKDRLGIVYTPIEVVDFILRGSNELLKKEFGEDFSSQNVKIQDPFSGCGTFLTRLIENKDLIKDKDLKRKYSNELSMCDTSLFAYYISTINVEHAYHYRKNESKEGGIFLSRENYEPFERSVFQDTFASTETNSETTDFFLINDKKRKKINSEEIRVIIGNPPYSVGQKNANDNNKNTEYETLDEKVRKTYNKDSKAQKNSIDSYVRAIRWATDRVGDKGMVAFVTNGSFIDSRSADGLRHHLEKDFNTLYILNLKGDIKGARNDRNPDRARKEGDGVFGQGSQNRIAISFLIKNPEKTKTTIYYAEVKDYLKRDEKLSELKNKKSVLEDFDWKEIKPDKYNDWVNQRDESYESFLEMGNKGQKQESISQKKNIEKSIKKRDTLAIFDLFSNGVITSRDKWVYNFDKNLLSENVKNTVSFYEKEVKRYKKEKLKAPEIINIDSFVNNDMTKIKWSRHLKKKLKQGHKIEYNKSNLRLGIYRPFTKQWLYYTKNRDLNEEISQTDKIFPQSESENLALCVSGTGSLSTIMVNMIPERDMLRLGQIFSRYRYEETQKGIFQEIDNIPNQIINKFKQHYKDKQINGDAIFYYVYGLLHSKDYKEKYSNNFGKMLPRIPMVNDFWDFSKSGKKLSDLHVNYESVKKYPIKIIPSEISKESLKVNHREMKFAPKPLEKGEKSKEKDKTQIRYNDYITIKDIPLKAYEYVVNGRSPIEWVMDRYKVKVDEDSGIKNDPNMFSDNPRHILDLLQRVTTVSVETVKIVDSLPKITAFDKTAA